uniref:Fibronectin type-II domain-containing protein n=1 Tax=Oryctolagus cuniculus TaxID=9986 RepID=G1SP69_RABIT
MSASVIRQTTAALVRRTGSARDRKPPASPPFCTAVARETTCPSVPQLRGRDVHRAPRAGDPGLCRAPIPPSLSFTCWTHVEGPPQVPRGRRRRARLEAIKPEAGGQAGGCRRLDGGDGRAAGPGVQAVAGRLRDPAEDLITHLNLPKPDIPSTPCIFPFTYADVMHYNCISVHSDFDWCSLDSQFQGRWRYCLSNGEHPDAQGPRSRCWQVDQVQLLTPTQS